MNAGPRLAERGSPHPFATPPGFATLKSISHHVLAAGRAGRELVQAPAPLVIHGASASFDAAWPTMAYMLSGAGHVLKLESRDPGPEKLAQWIDRGE